MREEEDVWMCVWISFFKNEGIIFLIEQRLNSSKEHTVLKSYLEEKEGGGWRRQRQKPDFLNVTYFVDLNFEPCKYSI